MPVLQRSIRLRPAVAAMMLLALPAFAHHSAAMFDASKNLDLTGSVAAWEFTNPHAWLHIKVPGDKPGTEVQWSIEFGSPNTLFRNGLRAKSLVPGDKVSVTIVPLRDGTPGGQIRTLTLPDGKVMQFGTAQPAAAPPPAPAAP